MFALISSTGGVGSAAKQLIHKTVPGQHNFIMSYDTFDSVYLRLVLNAAGVINNLNAGSFFLWYTIFQLK